MKAYRTTSYALYTPIRFPVSLNWTFLILESDEDVVEVRATSHPIGAGAQTRRRARSEEQHAGRLFDLGSTYSV
jgi:hypothetical protein